jgi:MFS transporter, OPA family, glycerol-3-phosphate transporter
MPAWLEKLLPILLLLGVVTVVVARLPKVALGHSDAFVQRRRLNWLPVGLAYAFLYFARYNLTAYKNAVGMSNDDYGTIDQWGAVVYGVSFVLNGPLTDRFGGRATILAAMLGSGLMNAIMGGLALTGWSHERVATFSALYAASMYFQSFGAVSIVKVNAAWFHLRERGTFGGIFGILISLGLYFAYDWGRFIAESFPHPYVFFIPAAVLAVMFVVVFAFVHDTPGGAGHTDFDTGDAGSGSEGGPALGAIDVVKRMVLNPTVLTITAIEFCSGFLRNAIMKWYPVFAKATHVSDHFVAQNWGMLLCCAGILGGVFAGAISDVVFGSRRGPVAAILYAGMTAAAALMFGVLGGPVIGWTVIFMSLCVIGVHGMLSGTASMDFGGKKNVGIVVGVIDGFVYLGTAAQAYVLKQVLPDGELGADPANWWTWPAAILPIAILGLALSARVWNATAKKAGATEKAA